MNTLRNVPQWLDYANSRNGIYHKGTLSHPAQLWLDDERGTVWITLKLVGTTTMTGLVASRLNSIVTSFRTPIYTEADIKTLVTISKSLKPAISEQFKCSPDLSTLELIETSVSQAHGPKWNATNQKLDWLEVDIRGYVSMFAQIDSIAFITKQAAASVLSLVNLQSPPT